MLIRPSHFFTRAVCLLAAASLILYAGDGRELALPGYHYQFPRDHFSHPSYQTEWWYYTGNLTAADGRQFGFELTFFRFCPDYSSGKTEPNPVWFPAEIYIAHFAITDIANRRFYHWERVNRADPALRVSTNHRPVSGTETGARAGSPTHLSGSSYRPSARTPAWC